MFSNILCNRTILVLSCFASIAAFFAGCAKKPSASSPTTQSENVAEETSVVEDFDVNAVFDVEAIMTVIRKEEPVHPVIISDLVQSAMRDYSPAIYKTADKYNAEYIECTKSLNYVVQDDSACESDERVVLNALIQENANIEWLKEHGQKDIQRSMWRVLKAEDYYSDFRWDSNDTDTIGALQDLIKAGADLNAPNWDGDIGAFAVDDAQFILAQLKSGAIKYDIKDKDGNCLLHKFASDENILDFLVQSGLDINTQNKDGQTPLFNVKDPQIVEQYIKAGANIHLEDHLGNTPIFQAAKNDTEHFPLSAQFVKYGADINHVNRAGQTAVFGVNIQNGLQDFLDLGARLSAKDNAGNTPLHTYDMTRDNKSLDSLDIYLNHGIDLSSPGDFPLLKLCLDYNLYKNLNQSCVEKLMKAGADVSAKDRNGLGFFAYLLKNHLPLDEDSHHYARNELKLKYDKLPDMINIVANTRDSYDRQEASDTLSASMSDRISELSFVERALKDMILDGVLDVGEQMPTGETFLFYVTDHSTAEALIKAGVDIHAKNKRGETALWRGNISALLEAGTDAKVVDNIGQTPLFARYPYYLGTDWGSEIAFNVGEIRLLLDAGANINATDANGRSVLFYVLESCAGIEPHECQDLEHGVINEYCTSDSAIQFFAHRGADVNIKDNDGITPLMLVCDIIDTDTEIYVSELIKAGADVNARDYSGTSVAEHCYKHSNEELQDILKKAGAK